MNTNQKNDDEEKTIIECKNTRYNNVDKLKFLCAFLIVCIHAQFSGVLGEYIVVIARIAVPIFLMISGYFYSRESFVRQLIKLLRLLIIANVFFLVWKIVISSIHNNVVGYIIQLFTVKNLLLFLLFNNSPIQSHLWYLGALIYTYFFVFIICHRNEKKGKRILYILTPFLLIGDLVLGKYSLLLLGREFPLYVVRNWLFVGIPYFSVGLWIRENLNTIKTRLGNRSRIIILMIIAAACNIFEHWILKFYEVNSSRDHYLSTTILAVLIFCFFLIHINNKDDILARIGKNDTTLIYIFHPACIFVVNRIQKMIGLEFELGIGKPIIVFLLSILFVRIYHNILKGAERCCFIKKQ